MTLAEEDWRSVKCAPLKHDSYNLVGGVPIMVGAIEQMIEECNLANSCGRVYSLDRTRLIDALKGGGAYLGEMLAWKLVPVTLEEGDKPVARLFGGTPEVFERPDSVRFPHLYSTEEGELLGILSQGDIHSGDARFCQAKGEGDETLDANSTHFSGCPDVVVFDDLGRGIRELRFSRETSDRCGGAPVPRVVGVEDSKEFLQLYREYVRVTGQQNEIMRREDVEQCEEELVALAVRLRKEVERCEEKLAALIGPKGPGEQWQDWLARPLHSAVLATLFERFAVARQRSLGLPSGFKPGEKKEACTPSSPLEPVIVATIRRNPSEVFARRCRGEDQRSGSSEEERQNGKSLWLHLLDDPWLRRRTVVVLNADDLREDGLAISTSLSWERTAQDTISQLRQSREYRQFLMFGNVVVRYGSTGALHISRSGAGLVYRLYFDPRHDDTTWEERKKDGVVMGDTSVFAAQIVKAVRHVCRQYSGAPLLEQVPSILNTAIPDAIRSCQRLSRTGYGEETWEKFSELSLKLGGVLAPKGEERPELWPHAFAQSVFCTRSANLAVNARSHSLKVPPALHGYAIRVVSATVPPTILRQWSILTQSLITGDLLSCARRIVRHGPKDVFNFDQADQYFDAREELTRHLVDVIHDECWLRCKQSPKKQFSKKVLSKVLGEPGELEEAWSKVCDEAVKRFNSHPVPSSIQSAYQLEGPGELINELVPQKKSRIARESHDRVSLDERLLLRKHWMKLWPGHDLAKNGLWSHFRSQRCDEHFEAILVFARHRIEPAEPGDSVPIASFSRALLPEPVVAPLVEFGKPDKPLYVVDRREVEGFRAIKRLIKEHIDQVREQKAKRPLCIALFGPPGSGKSFAVRAINKSLNDVMTVEIPAFNLGELTNVEDLVEAFGTIAEKSTVGGEPKVPIAFFDEFDSRYESTELGWLKFFLAPMEDGKFRKSQVQNAILVFAGGTSETFAAFSLANRAATDEQKLRFVKAKGPDFTSRLSGHLDITGVNPTSPEDELYLIRRAMLIRGLLADMQDLQEPRGSAQHNLGGRSRARIDDKMLKAILTAPHYKNGGRSVRMLLELCRDQYGTISSSEAPPIHQLDMHVDGKAFLAELRS